ncbi:hypothetical protein [Burkholderia pyrrocinia]|nr:hypothetical protein [Burkholderia pyrrocinia]
MNNAETEYKAPPAFSFDVPGAGMDEGVMTSGTAESEEGAANVDTK